MAQTARIPFQPSLRSSAAELVGYAPLGVDREEKEGVGEGGGGGGAAGVGGVLDVQTPSQPRTNINIPVRNASRGGYLSGYSVGQVIERSRVRVPAGAAGEFSSPGSTFCALLFRYPFHRRVTAISRKRSRSFCQKCRWQVIAKHIYTLPLWR